MIRYSNNYEILSECRCGGQPRIAFEHNINCPRRLSFYGAPWQWGVGKNGEIRMDHNKNYFHFSYTWVLLDASLVKEYQKNIRKDKLFRIQKIKQ